VGGQSDLTMVGQAVLTITPPAGSSNAGSLVPAALNLGWRLAQLYDAPIPRGAVAIRAPGEHLPGVAEHGSAVRYVILLGQVEAALKPLREILQFSGSDADFGSIRHLAGNPAGREEVRGQIFSLHVRITDSLAANAARLGTAYGLGRALADTCHATGDVGGERLATVFNPYRLENLYDWLGQLDELFPDRAARAVARSLRMWESWVQAPGKSRLPKRVAPTPGTDARAASRALIRQGELWRRVLTAEQDPLRLLGPQDYVNAGIGFLVRIRRMVTQFAVQWAGVIVLLLAGLGAAIWAAVTYASTDAGKLAAVLASLVGTLGLSWKGVGGTLGKALGVVQRPLWDAEVDTALAVAITKLPRPDDPTIAYCSREYSALGCADRIG
jgi:hypothetical protein